jgi:hypothetical protein
MEQPQTWHYGLFARWWELLPMLDEAGFRDTVIEGDHTGIPATPDDGNLVFIARRP